MSHPVNIPNSLHKAKRVNQAYTTYYGTQYKLTDPITRDMASDKVVARRSWFPSFATAQWFSGIPFLQRGMNVAMTRGKDLRNNETFRARSRPGQLANTSQFGTYTNSRTVATDDEADHTKLLYIIIFILAIVFISLLF